MKIVRTKGSVKKEPTFKGELERSAMKSRVLLIGVSCILFALGLYATAVVSNEINGRRHLRVLKENFLNTIDSSAAYLRDDKSQSLWREALLQGELDTNLIYSFNSYNSTSRVKSDFVLTDVQGRIIHSSLSEENLSTYFLSFNEIIIDNATRGSKKGLYTTVYLEEKEKPRLALYQGIYDEDKLLGFAALYYSHDGWNSLFSNYHFDGVITDESNNIIYTSRASLSQGINKFYKGEEIRRFNNGVDEYLILGEYLKDYDVNIYSLIYYPKNTEFIISGVGLILIFGFLWLSLGKKMSREMALKKSQDLDSLVEEIKTIRRGDIDHRVDLKVENELALVGNEINRMLDNISSLNEKNTELLRLNNIIEMKQLTEQINPHFLYNTLETIRYLVLLEPERAEALIVKFTAILRYSINNSSREVILLEDMEYIKDYLNIQRNRFQDRFNYTLDIEKGCESSIIPKLLLQPIIENSIKYGFKGRMQVEVRIRGYMENEVLILEVWDNGSGMEEEAVAELEEAIEKVRTDSEHNGLYNIGRRLYLKNGNKSGIRLARNEAGGLTVTLSISQKGRNIHV